MSWNLKPHEEGYNPLDHSRGDTLILGKWRFREYGRGDTVLHLYQFWDANQEQTDDSPFYVVKAYNKRSFYPDTRDVLLLRHGKEVKCKSKYFISPIDFFEDQWNMYFMKMHYRGDLTYYTRKASLISQNDQSRLIKNLIMCFHDLYDGGNDIFLHNSIRVRKFMISDSDYQKLKEAQDKYREEHPEDQEMKNFQPQIVNISLLDAGYAKPKFQIVDLYQTMTKMRSFQWIPPEIKQNHPYTEKSDVWCLGAVIYDLIYGYDAFFQVHRYNGNKPFPARPQNSNFAIILEKTLHPNPDQRWGWLDLFQFAKNLDYRANLAKIIFTSKFITSQVQLYQQINDQIGDNRKKLRPDILREIQEDFLEMNQIKSMTQLTDPNNQLLHNSLHNKQSRDKTQPLAVAIKDMQDFYVNANQRLSLKIREIEKTQSIGMQQYYEFIQQQLRNPEIRKHKETGLNFTQFLRRVDQKDRKFKIANKFFLITSQLDRMIKLRCETVKNAIRGYEHLGQLIIDMPPKLTPEQIEGLKSEQYSILLENLPAVYYTKEQYDPLRRAICGESDMACQERERVRDQQKLKILAEFNQLKSKMYQYESQQEYYSSRVDWSDSKYRNIENVDAEELQQSKEKRTEFEKAVAEYKARTEAAEKNLGDILDHIAQYQRSQSEHLSRFQENQRLLIENQKLRDEILKGIDDCEFYKIDFEKSKLECGLLKETLKTQQEKSTKLQQQLFESEEKMGIFAKEVQISSQNTQNEHQKELEELRQSYELQIKEKDQEIIKLEEALFQIQSNSTDQPTSIGSGGSPGVQFNAIEDIKLILNKQLRDLRSTILQDDSVNRDLKVKIQTLSRENEHLINQLTQYKDQLRQKEENLDRWSKQNYRLQLDFDSLKREYTQEIEKAQNEVIRGNRNQFLEIGKNFEMMMEQFLETEQTLMRQALVKFSDLNQDAIIRNEEQIQQSISIGLADRKFAPNLDSSSARHFGSSGLNLESIIEEQLMAFQQQISDANSQLVLDVLQISQSKLVHPAYSQSMEKDETIQRLVKTIEQQTSSFDQISLFEQGFKNTKDLLTEIQSIIGTLKIEEKIESESESGLKQDNHIEQLMRDYLYQTNQILQAKLGENQQELVKEFGEASNTAQLINDLSELIQQFSNEFELVKNLSQDLKQRLEQQQYSELKPKNIGHSVQHQEPNMEFINQVFDEKNSQINRLSEQNYNLINQLKEYEEEFSQIDKDRNQINNSNIEENFQKEQQIEQLRSDLKDIEDELQQQDFKYEFQNNELESIKQENQNLRAELQQLSQFKMPNIHQQQSGSSLVENYYQDVNRIAHQDTTNKALANRTMQKQEEEEFNRNIIERLEIQIQQKNNLLQQYQTNQEQLNEHIELRENQFHQTLNEKEKFIKSLQDQIQLSQEMLASQKEESNKFQQQFSQLNQIKPNTMEYRNSPTIQERKYQDRINDLKNTVCDREEKIQELEKQLEIMKNSFNDSSRQLKTLQTSSYQNTPDSKKDSALNNSIDVQNSKKFQLLQNQLIHAEDELKSSENKVRTFQLITRELEETLNYEKNKNDILEDQISKMNDQIDSLESINQNLVQQVEARDHKIREISQHSPSKIKPQIFSDEITEQILNSSQKRFQRYENEIKLQDMQINSIIEKHQQDIEVLRAKYKNYLEGLINQQINDEQQINEYQGRIKEYILTIKEYQKDIQHFQTRYERQKQISEQKEFENNQLKADLQRINKKISPNKYEDHPYQSQTKHNFNNVSPYQEKLNSDSNLQKNYNPLNFNNY